MHPSAADSPRNCISIALLQPNKRSSSTPIAFVCATLLFVFDRFAGKPVSVIGGTISEGEWFGDVAHTCQLAGVSELPKFNGGIYYLKSGPKATAVYERARALLLDYDAMGLVRLRDAPDDELLMAIAMAQEGCCAIPEDGEIMGDFRRPPCRPRLHGQGPLRNAKSAFATSPA